MKRFQLLLSLGLASTLLLAACGGDDDSDDDDNGDTPSATQTTAAGETPSGGDPTNTPESDDDDDDDDNGNGNGGGSELEDLLTDLAGKSFQATYEIVTTLEGTEQTGSATIAQDEPRFATVMELASGTIAIIEIESGSYSCFGTGVTGICSRAADSQGSIFDLREVTEDAGDLSGYQKIENRNINGRDSSCWVGTQPDSDIETTFCVDEDEGILTYTGTEEFEMTLTDYSDDIDEELFELPYAVQ